MLIVKPWKYPTCFFPKNGSHFRSKGLFMFVFMRQTNVLLPGKYFGSRKSTPSILTANSCHSDMVICELLPDKINNVRNSRLKLNRIFVSLQLAVDLRMIEIKDHLRRTTWPINLCHYIRKKASTATVRIYPLVCSVVLSFNRKKVSYPLASFFIEVY